MHCLNLLLLIGYIQHIVPYQKRERDQRSNLFGITTSILVTRLQIVALIIKHI